MNDKRKVYLAAPLFGLTERRTNRAVAEALARQMPEIEVLLPQDFKHHGRFNDPRTFGVIYKACVDAIAASDALVAWLDGCDSDSGTSFEIGYACAKGIPVIGVRTDYRANQEKGLNLMLSRGCAALVFRPAFDENLEALCRDVSRALKRVVTRKAAS
ncbi:MAG: nucleoside 2-deoxyribosyltransferase [Planctomycetes bacterium]|nr:nucleoside 2-deoxyribosyltransferase [Planctomycetota bacterium]